MLVEERASRAHHDLAPPRIVRLYERATAGRTRLARIADAVLDGFS